MTNFEIGALLFLQLTVILATCRLVGWLGRRLFGQTQVVMEMVAGVLLGPSLFGWLAPGAQAALFPRQLAVLTAEGATVHVAHPSMTVLYAIAQLGLVVYMFLVGLEFDPGLMRGRLRNAALVSGAGILVPFGAAAVLAMVVRGRSDLFAPSVSALTAVLFLGSAVAITAFPMLARILYERGLTQTPMGTLALAAGSIDDALAWCLLAFVLATLNDSPETAVITIGGGVLYGLFMMFLAKPRLRIFQGWYEREGRLTPELYVSVFLVAMLGAYVTDFIGIYAVFGAFIAGAAMPKGAFAGALAERTELLTTSLLLPVFFVYSGLNTRLGLVNTASLWGLTALVILLSSAGKGLACMLAARASGEGWNSAARIGVLMNARGLMELILLNIGLDHGVITPTLFTILVLMAVVTTLVASPLYNWLSRLDLEAQPPTPSEA